MSVFLPYLVNWLQEYGYPALWALVFIGASGVPLPITLVLLAAGAFAALGDFNLGALTLIGVSAAVAGDSVGYSIGRVWGSRLLLWLESSERHFISQRAIRRSRQLFHARGGLAIFLGRTVFSAVGVPITLLSGAECYPYRKFLFFDSLGELAGIATPLGLGFIFGASWEAVGEVLGTVSLFLLALAVAIWISFYLVALLRHLRSARASRQVPATEHQVLGSAEGTPSPGTASPGTSGPLPL
jgi:membrane-associated protein